MVVSYIAEDLERYAALEEEFPERRSAHSVWVCFDPEVERARRTTVRVVSENKGNVW